MTPGVIFAIVTKITPGVFFEDAPD
jgi:hypothetical protein